MVRAWLNFNAMLYETFVSMSMQQNLFVSIFVHKSMMMLRDAEYTTFKMFVMQMSNYLFVISFHLRWSETKKLKISISDNIFFLYLIIIKHCNLRELENTIKIFIAVVVSMATIQQK